MPDATPEPIVDIEPIHSILDVMAPDNNFAETPPLEEDVPEDASPTALQIGDAEYTPEQALELIQKGLGADRKFEEAAALRKELQAAIAIKDALESGNPNDLNLLRQAIDQRLAPQGGTTSQTYAVPFEELSDEGKMLFVQQQQNEQRQNLIVEAIRELAGAMEQQTTLSTRQQKIADSAKELSAQGIEANADLITKAMDATGIADPSLAFKAHYFDQIAKGSFKAGHQQGQKLKPPAPGSNGKTYDPKDHTADEIVRLRSQGYTRRT